MSKATEKTEKGLAKLEGLLADKRHLLIVMQDNPDPDAIAAAVALRELVHSIGKVTCSLTHGGSVGRAENRALVKYLGLKLRSYDRIDLSQFDVIATVDTQPGTGNNPLASDRVPDMVFDHHPLRDQTRRSALYDVRTTYGATATILYEYLVAAGVRVSVQLATAVVYAIRSDTQDLGMEASRADVAAIEALFPVANKRMLSQIQKGKVERGYFQMLLAGLADARVQGCCIVTHLGDARIAEMIAEIADILLRDDETTWVMASGYCSGRLIISLRTQEPHPPANEVIRGMVSGIGTGGGHATMAGGQVPLNGNTAIDAAKDLTERLERRFLEALGQGGMTARPLTQ